MNILFLLVLGIGRAWAQNETALIQSPFVDDITYHSVLKSDPQARSFSHVFLEMRRSIKEGLELKSNFLLAQENYLTNENRANIKTWRAVTRWAHKADWSVTQREMIQVAFLRWAQLTRDAKEEVQLIESAYALDPGLKIEGLQLSPGVAAHWMELKNAARLVKIDVGRFSGFSHLLINGSPYILSDTKLSIPDGVHRFTWISNQFLPVTRVLDTKRVNQVVLPQEPLVSGSCEKPLASGGLRELTEDFVELKSAKIQIVFPEDCVADLNTSVPATKKLAEHSPFEDAITQLSISKENSHVRSDNESMGATQKQAQPFYKRPKFWLGSVLVSGVLLYFHQQNDRAAESPPTHREGF